MHMVIIRIHCSEDERRIFLTGVRKTFPQFIADIILQPLPPVFCAPDDVVLKLVGAVVEVADIHGRGLRLRSGIPFTPGLRAIAIFTVYLVPPGSRPGFSGMKTAASRPIEFSLPGLRL